MPRDDLTHGDHLEPPWDPVPDRLPSFADCRRYAVGHRPHHIQVRLSWESPPSDWASAVVMDAAADAVVLAVDDELLRCSTHDATRLAAQVRRLGPVVRLNRRRRVLAIDLQDRRGRAVFSMALPGEPWTPCSPG